MWLGLIMLFHVVLIMGGFTWIAVKAYMSPSDPGKNQRLEMGVFVVVYLTGLALLSSL
jgi:hypothetical protein